MFFVTYEPTCLSTFIDKVSLFCFFYSDLWQTPPTQGQSDTPLQSELMPELTGTDQSPAEDHMVAPPSTVDTAALSEEPLPGESTWGRVWM